MLIAVPEDYSFPSGHTTASVISAVILMQEDKKLGIPAVILAVLIAFSRMYLFVHFPTDILGGLILGLIIGFSMKPVWNKISDYLRKKAPLPEFKRGIFAFILLQIPVQTGIHDG